MSKLEFIINWEITKTISRNWCHVFFFLMIIKNKISSWVWNNLQEVYWLIWHATCWTSQVPIQLTSLMTTIISWFSCLVEFTYPEFFLLDQSFSYQMTWTTPSNYQPYWHLILLSTYHLHIAKGWLIYH